MFEEIGGTMKYEKPELTKLSNAAEAVRGNGKPFGKCCDSTHNDTPQAYEADE
jgi:hypothetical protein